MTTYQDLQNRIADELGQRSDLASEITLAIQTAIQKWEREPFYFNELYNEALLTTVTGQEFYGGPGTEPASTTAAASVASGGTSLGLTNAAGFAAGQTLQIPLDNGDLWQTALSGLSGTTATISAVPANRSIPSGVAVQVIGDPTAATSQLKYQLARIDKLHVLISNNRYPLNPRSWSYLEDVSVNPNVMGLPVDYAYAAGQLRLYPIPNMQYAVTATGTQRLTPLLQAGDENAWTLDAEALIRAEAKMDIYENILQEPQLAQRMKIQIYGDPTEPRDRGYLFPLKAETTARRRAKIRPSYF